MPFVTTVPEAQSSAAGAAQGIGASMSAGTAAAAAPATAVIPPAADLVSALSAAQIAAHAQVFQTVSAQAAAQQDLFATTMGTSGTAYAVTEAAYSSALRCGANKGRALTSPYWPATPGADIAKGQEMIDCHAGAVAAHGAPTRSQIMAMQSEHQAIIRDALAAAEFWGGTRSLVWKQFLAELGRNFQVVYEHGSRAESRLKPNSSLGWRWVG